jgi:DNA-binding transcriptional regulator LsrR (DeoR family)
MAMDKKNIIYKILEYYYLEDLSQFEIAEKLGITRVAVSRYISRARRLSLIEFKIKYPANYTVDRHESLEEEFKKQYGLKECIIVNSHTDYRDTIKELSEHLSNTLPKIINDNTYIGVGWGTTLETTVQMLELEEKHSVKVVPLIGGYGRYFDDMHSNNIARMLAEKYGGSSYVTNIPAAFDTKEIKDAILRDSAAKEIFKLAKRVEVALLCMSDLSTQSTLYRSDQINQEDIDYLSSLGIIGDINYVFVDKDGNFVPNEISERTTTIFPIELMKSVKNVIGIAIGERKAQILRAALKGGLINIMVTDLDAVNKILEMK